MSMISFNEKIRKIQIIFDIEHGLRKSEFGVFFKCDVLAEIQILKVI